MVPPAPALDHLDGALARLRQRPAAPRWVGRDALHITLAFFGEVPQSQVPALTGALAAALDSPSVHLRLAGAGTFPEWGAPRVLWVGVDGDLEVLAALAGAAADAARSTGVPVDRRPYRPHLTVGRWPAAAVSVSSAGSAATASAAVSSAASAAVSPAGSPAARPLVAALERYTGPHFTAGEVVLMRSHHGPRARYETVAAWGGTPGGAVGTHRLTPRQDQSYQA